MKSRGYEVVGEEKSRHVAMLCLAGTKYSKLFRKRIVDFAQNDGVGFFKWDGIQFSCSEKDHGHPVGIYSRRAVLRSLIDKCYAVREKNPDVFLNITSGTWLSPWWVKYANQIWMQGYDYGYSDVPSISRRDGAITYRDYVLYDDFKNKNLWFPISNLMTHGIIKGNLQKLGGEKEPLDKFTDNALLYFARGVSMWELYISPDLLTEGEWRAIAESIQWAKDRFHILSSTEMIGGDPKKREPYGYNHFKKKHGIIAVRNPFIEPVELKVKLDPAQGLSPDSEKLVLEKIYPCRRISPELYRAGDDVALLLDGYETAIYEIYPVEEANKPLLTGVVFEVKKTGERTCTQKLIEGNEDIKILNPEKIEEIKFEGKKVDPKNLKVPLSTFSDPVKNHSVEVINRKKRSDIYINFELDNSLDEATLAVLVEPAGEFKSKDEPVIKIIMNGKKQDVVEEKQKGKWYWNMLDVKGRKHNAKVKVRTVPKIRKWKGKASVWLIYKKNFSGKQISMGLKEKFTEKPMPPRPWPAGVYRKNVKLGEVEIRIE